MTSRITTYKAKPGAQFPDSKAQVFGEELENIYRKNLNLDPEAIVNAVESNDSLELHSYFEWDNNKCGTLYRKKQARELLKHLIVIKVINGGKVIEQTFAESVFINVQDKTNSNKMTRIRIYSHHESIANDPELIESVIDRYQEQINSLISEMKKYKELLPWAGEIEIATRRFLKNKEKIAA